MNRSPMSIINDARSKNAWVDLFLGAPGYRYVPKYSPSPYNTDLAALMGVLYDTITNSDRQEIARQIEIALHVIMKTYDGLIPTASVILMEALEKSRGNGTELGLPLSVIAVELNNSIMIFHDRLANDKNGFGLKWPDGLLGELRHLSKNTTDIGGPSFLV